MATEYYLIVIEGDVEPYLYGPYTNEEDRNNDAQRQRAEDPEKENGLYRLKIVDGKPELDSFWGEHALTEPEEVVEEPTWVPAIGDRVRMRISIDPRRVGHITATGPQLCLVHFARINEEQGEFWNWLRPDALEFLSR